MFFFAAILYVFGIGKVSFRKGLVIALPFLFYGVGSDPLVAVHQLISLNLTFFQLGDFKITASISLMVIDLFRNVYFILL